MNILKKIGVFVKIVTKLIFKTIKEWDIVTILICNQIKYKSDTIKIVDTKINN